MSLSKSAIIEKAQKLVLKGKIKQAIAEWQKLAAENPNDGNTFNAIGDLYIKSNDKANATVAFIKAADAFHAAAFELKSIALYKKALKVDPSKIEIHEKLAAVYAERGLIGNAVDDYLKAAKYYYKNGNFRAALSVYRKLSNLDPENANIRLEIAEMCEKQDIPEEAVEEYKKVVALYDGKNMSAEAEEIRNKIKTLDPSYASAQEVGKKADSEIPPEVGLEPAHSDAEGGDEIEVVEAVDARAEQSASAEESAQGFLAPEAEPLLEEQTIFPSDHAQAGIPSSENGSEKVPDKSQLENALTEAEVYIQYGLIDKAIAQIKGLVASFPSELKPRLKLKEIYTQQGMTQEAIATCQDLVKHYDSLGDEAAKNGVLQDLEAFGVKDGEVIGLSPTSSQVTTDNRSSYFDSESVQGAPDVEADPFGEVIVGADSLSGETSDEPTLAALEEMASDNPVFHEMAQNASGAQGEDPLQALDPTPGNEEYVDLNSILSEGFGGDEDEIEGSLEKSFRSLQESHDGHNSEESETQYDLGIAYKEMGMIAEAMKAFELAALGQGRFEDANIMLAACYREEGSTPKAAEALEKALAEGENEAGSFIALKYELALLYEKLGNKQCKPLYQEILEADPTFRNIMQKCSDLSSKGPDHKKTSPRPKPATQNK